MGHRPPFEQFERLREVLAGAVVAGIERHRLTEGLGGVTRIALPAKREAEIVVGLGDRDATSASAAHAVASRPDGWRNDGACCCGSSWESSPSAGASSAHPPTPSCLGMKVDQHQASPDFSTAPRCCR
jgi:hypothetical protein